MGWFTQQAERLMREIWPNPQLLAEELYAILSSTGIPMTTDGPVTINMPPGSNSPGLVINGNPDQTPIQFNPKGQPPVTLTVGGVNVPNVGLLGSDALDGTPLGPGNLQGSESPAVTGTGGGGFAGSVVSGTGASYQVLLTTGQTVAATVRQIDLTETVPAGTAVILVKVGAIYYFQPPVWL